MPVSYQIGNGASPRHIPALCNDFGNEIPYDEYLRAFGHCLPQILGQRARFLSVR
ncbi:MAG TPA: hypothetical protein VMF86_05380 [Stellaceae bacterium]|nr:hypothetical protein [Stellaceae bacterium]